MNPDYFYDVPNSVSLQLSVYWGMIVAGLVIITALVIRGIHWKYYNFKTSQQKAQREEGRAKHNALPKKQRDLIDQGLAPDKFDGSLVADLMAPTYYEPSSRLRFIITTFSVAAGIALFVMFGSGMYQRVVWMSDTSEAFGEWADSTYGIELTENEAYALRWDDDHSERYIEASYKGSNVELDLVRVGSAYHNATSWELRYRDGAQPFGLLSDR